MEETGLITRERMAHDQRRLRVSLTPQSRQLAQRLIPLVEQRYQLLEESLGLRSIQQVYDALDALLARTPRVDAADPGLAIDTAPAKLRRQNTRA